jgi:hypothetical protein
MRDCGKKYLKFGEGSRGRPPTFSPHDDTVSCAGKGLYILRDIFRDLRREAKFLKIKFYKLDKRLFSHYF